MPEKRTGCRVSSFSITCGCFHNKVDVTWPEKQIYLIEKMKIYHYLIFPVLLLIAVSCKKDQPNAKTSPPRKIRYELYTNEDFSNDQKNIFFSIFMRNGQRVIFDSPLATMKIKDIPDSNHRIVIEKLAPDNDTSTLVVGFNYQIENVGFSWYLETFPAGDTIKVLSYPFR
jgi:hypothetical protein